MAIDSENKRRGILSFRFRPVPAVPDGALNSVGERGNILGLYAWNIGVVAGVAVQDFILYLSDPSHDLVVTGKVHNLVLPDKEHDLSS